MEKAYLNTFNPKSYEIHDIDEFISAKDTHILPTDPFFQKASIGLYKLIEGDEYSRFQISVFPEKNSDKEYSFDLLSCRTDIFEGFIFDGNSIPDSISIECNNYVITFNNITKEFLPGMFMFALSYIRSGLNTPLVVKFTFSEETPMPMVFSPKGVFGFFTSKLLENIKKQEDFIHDFTFNGKTYYISHSLGFHSIGKLILDSAEN